MYVNRGGRTVRYLQSTYSAFSDSQRSQMPLIKPEVPQSVADNLEAAKVEKPGKEQRKPIKANPNLKVQSAHGTKPTVDVNK